MKISITYIDGSIETFSNIDDTDIGDDFISLNDEDGNVSKDINISQIRKIEYD
jgi:hypothetical protein